MPTQIDDDQQPPRLSGLMERIAPHLSWIPYVSIPAMVVFEIQLQREIAGAGSVGEILFGKGGLLLMGMALVAGLMLVHLVACFRTGTRAIACFSLFMAGLLVITFVGVVEHLLPPVARYSNLQLSLQAQLNRRQTDTITSHCGLDTRLKANSLGWIDRERGYQKSTPRIVFIGDSFLESMTTKPLAARVEERLSAAGMPAEVINLSKDDSEPETEYRHRFYELAFEYQPDHVIMFIYSGNDLSTHYIYARYVAPAVRMTDAALTFLQQAALDSRILGACREQGKLGAIFSSKQAMFDAVGREHATLGQLNLAYLAGVAYAAGQGPSLSERCMPNTVARCWNLRDKISDVMKSLKRANRGEQPCACTDLAVIRPRYNEIFDLPQEERLRAISRFIARDYCQIMDDQPFWDVLRAQDPWFLEQVTRCPDGMGNLLNTVVEATYGLNSKKKIKMHRVEKASGEYVRLFTEFNDEARKRGASFTLVFIPVATNIDDQFNRCWSSLRNTGKGDGRGPPMVAAVMQKVFGIIDAIDLTQYPEKFQGGYWIFDGHWNESGNEAASRIVADYLLTNLDPAPSRP